MSIIVQKYGGSSVENLERMTNVANRIIEQKKQNNDLVIVISAQGKTTNTLLEKAKEYSNYNEDTLSKRDLDFLLSTGEMQSSALLSILLNSKGYKTICITGFQAGILTDSNYGNAKILDIESKNILNLITENYIVIVTGFQGMDKFGNITTLGRGGSDLSAVALATSLNADVCEIYSDVDGIYSSDPKVIENALLLDSISFDEMLEAASSGAKVLHNRSVSLAKENNLKILSKSSLTNSSGTEVSDISYNDSKVHIISKQDDMTKISIIGSMLLENKKILSTIYSIADKNNIKIYMITICEISINLLINRSDSKLFMRLLHEELIEKNTIE